MEHIDEFETSDGKFFSRGGQQLLFHIQNKFFNGRGSCFHGGIKLRTNAAVCNILKEFQYVTPIEISISLVHLNCGDQVDSRLYRFQIEPLLFQEMSDLGKMVSDVQNSLFQRSIVALHVVTDIEMFSVRHRIFCPPAKPMNCKRFILNSQLELFQISLTLSVKIFALQSLNLNKVKLKPPMETHDSFIRKIGYLSQILFKSHLPTQRGIKVEIVIVKPIYQIFKLLRRFHFYYTP